MTVPPETPNGLYANKKQVPTFREFGSICKDINTYSVRLTRRETKIRHNLLKKKINMKILENFYQILERKTGWYIPFKAVLRYNFKAANKTHTLFSLSSVYQEVNGAASNLHEADKRFKAFEFHLDFIKHPEVQEYLSVIQLDLKKAYY